MGHKDCLIPNQDKTGYIHAFEIGHGVYQEHPKFSEDLRLCQIAELKLSQMGWQSIYLEKLAGLLQAQAEDEITLNGRVNILWLFLNVPPKTRAQAMSQTITHFWKK
jgi:hypothetical protein